MGSERRRRAGALLNLTPLIDIVFLLLVFFMLTSHFIEDQTIDINLPKANSGSRLNVWRIQRDWFRNLFLSLMWGKGTFGTGTSRKSQSGCQPSLTSKMSSFSGGTCCLTSSV